VSPVFDEGDEAATPLAPEEMRDLLPSYIAHRNDLNEAEQANIARAQKWVLGRRRDLLTETFVKGLHKQMFGDVWRWAGKFRTTPRNIGIDHWLIPVDLRQLLEDSKAWMEFKSYPADEIAVRFHHRLVWIHPFLNGNGRHARLMADLLVMRLGFDRFSWGRESLCDAGKTRARYIAALRAADNHDISELLVFSRD
jgi:Fic-DOC domain mobile mystery protein B